MSESTNHVAERVIQRVSDASGRTALEIPPLYNAVDPEALERLVKTMSDGVVSFHYAGHEVTVDSDGEIQVSERETARDGPPPEEGGAANYE